MDLRILPPEEMIEATIELPLSKSICNRLLIINALAPGSKPLSEIADCDDSRLLARAIADLRAATPGSLTVDVGAAGTAFRFFTALAAVTEGADCTIDGTERLRQRPIAPLVDALRSLGADIRYLGLEGHAPLRICGKRLSGGSIKIDASVSSQFISALMMVAPAMESPLTIEITGEIISRPYIAMTAKLMEQSGAYVDFSANTINIQPSTYSPVDSEIERDWSAASYWYELTAISAGFITLPGLTTDSLQGDSRAARYFEKLGVLTSESEDVDDALELSPSPEQHSRFEEDLTDNPDLAPALAVTAAMLGIPFHLRGLASLRVKETDRLAAIRNELDKFGIIVEIRDGNQLVWNGERHPIFSMPRIDTYNDHRMAMAFAPASVFIPGLIINDCEVVSKSYPSYWDDLRAAGFTLAAPDEQPDDNVDFQAPPAEPENNPNPLQI